MADRIRKSIGTGKLEIVDGIVKKAVYPEDELDKRKFEPFWSHLPAVKVGTAQNGKEELNAIVGEATGFDTVKPTILIKNLLSHFGKDAVVLDFFAGSGTTGQAVWELNNEDGGNRRFILCTNNENDICESITFPRLLTVASGIRKDSTQYSDGLPVNLKYYRTDFINKNSDELFDELLEHMKEMIQLKHGIDLKKGNYVIIMDDDEMDEFEKNIEKQLHLEAVYINQDVLLSTSQEKLLQNINTYIIPDCFFDFELREAGELW